MPDPEAASRQLDAGTSVLDHYDLAAAAQQTTGSRQRRSSFETALVEREGRTLARAMLARKSSAMS